MLSNKTNLTILFLFWTKNDKNIWISWFLRLLNNIRSHIHTCILIWISCSSKILYYIIKLNYALFIWRICVGSFLSHTFLRREPKESADYTFPVTPNHHNIVCSIVMLYSIYYTISMYWVKRKQPWSCYIKVLLSYFWKISLCTKATKWSYITRLLRGGFGGDLLLCIAVFVNVIRRFLYECVNNKKYEQDAEQFKNFRLRTTRRAYVRQN